MSNKPTIVSHFHSFSSSGWRTASNAPYPHHLIVQLKGQSTNNQENDGSSNAEVELTISKIQILVQGETLDTPQKLEILVANSNIEKEGHEDDDTIGTDVGSLNFTRLGSVVLSACITGREENSNCQTTSTKQLSISLKGVSASFVKISIYDSNDESLLPPNKNAQIGFSSLSLLAKAEAQSANATVQILTADSELNCNELNSRLEALDTLKREKARDEVSEFVLTYFTDTATRQHISSPSKKSLQIIPKDFVSAARIKEALTKLHKYMTIMNETQEAMQCAAEEEDYLKASTLKAKRDASRVAFFSTFEKAEKDPKEEFQDDRKDSDFINQFDDMSLSLSTIRRDQDDPSVMTATTNRQFLIDRPILPKADTVEAPFLDGVSIIGSETNRANEVPFPCIEESSPHPLEGVPGFQDLPVPEEIDKIDGGMSTSFSQNTSHTSTDSIHKMENILGPYCTRCLLSKNWSLREAAILKLCQKLKEVIANLKSSASHWWESFSRGICVILERVIDDRIVQVFLTGLIFLDDCMIEFEAIGAAPKEIISLIGNVIIKLVGKLGDSNPKVVEGSETALMSLALSKVIGPLYVGSQVIKLMSSTDSKALKSVTKRCEFLKELLEEFGTAAPSVQKHLEFLRAFCLNHKEVEPREAAKELSVSLFLRDGSEVLSLLNDLSERQTKEYKLAFLKAKRREKVPAGHEIDNTHAARDDHYSQNIGMTQKLTGEGMSDIVKTSGRRGRGRGRGRSRRSH